MHYLTVQDVLWVNLQVTGRSQPFKFATLEEATFTQYVYGQAATPAEHAARFLTGWKKFQPFAEGNDRTGFVAWLGFLALNGLKLNLPETDQWAWYQTATTLPADVLLESFNHDEPSARAVLTDIIRQFEMAPISSDSK